MIDITSIPQLDAFCRSFASQLSAGAVYGLHGELGAGKTTFVKHLATALGIENEVISPTFIYHQTYIIPSSGNAIQRLHHYDLYRLASDADADALGLELDDPHGVHFVEWIENAPALATRAAKTLSFKIELDGRRTVEVANV